MWDLLNSPDIQSAMGFLKDGAKSDLMTWLTIVWVVWRTMGKKVGRAFKKMREDFSTEITSHFDKMEQAVVRVATEVSSLKETVAKDLAAQSVRLGRVENGLDKLSSRVETLEKP